ncbi:DotA/TraY family protein [Pectobacterium sp. A535-S3-A17]|uniref:DotA/TraY family protein n=1 Tax=Pectobacterium quasiaquaticum TaxID=2774015 RepID=UPI0018758185|nr:DotA/TraY family protein [Pectobacterium quasiaquaticum]MBE5212575.1 DotA/TraY family protein [Pectobacterium quasiaquaticum]MBE5225619.1 DotA/TraY family protein [Pectobacterium quasiaquaticum]
MNKIKMNPFVIFIALLGFLLMTQTAHAADLFTVPETDKSKLWFLDVLFPDDLAQSPLAKTMTILNSAVLLVGGILAAYTLIAGTMSTAHDGEMLGKKWSSMWLPVRTALGTAMILPAAGGFCAAQVMVLWMINQGIGLADTVWNTYAANPSDGAVITTSASYQELDRIAKTAFINNVCMLKAGELWNKSAANDLFPHVTPQFSMTSEKGQYLYRYNYGANNAGNDMNKNLLVSKAACGSITLTDPEAKAAYDEQAKAQAQAAIAAGGMYMAYMPQDIKTNISGIVESHNTAFIALNNSMKLLAEQYVADNNIDIQNGINGATANYVSVIDSAVRAAFSTGDQWDDFKENVQKDGWFMAGAWSMKLIRVQDAINGAAHNLPVAGQATMEYGDIFDNSLNAIMAKVSQDMARSTTASRYANGIDAQNRTEANTSGKSGSGPKTDDAGKIVSSLQSEANKSISGAMAGFLSSSVINGRKQGKIVAFSTDTTAANLQAINPLLAVKGLGDTISAAGWTLLGSSAVVGAGLGAWTSWTSSWVSGAFGAMGVVMPLVVPLWIAGDTLAVVIPMLPYVMWFGVCVGWMILCLEAMVAAPLWVITHLHPDGDGVVGRGGAGYGLVLSLTMRPALMITGLIAAYTMLPILGGIVNETFSGAFGMMSANAGIGIIESLALIAVYIAMMFTVVKKSLSLIHVIPDEIMKWLGVNSGQSMAGYAQSASKGVEGAMFTKTVLDQVSQSSNSLGNQVRNAQINSDREQQRELQQQQQAQQRNAQAVNKANDTGSAFRTHMSNAGPLDQQDEYQSLESANSAYNAAEAAEAVGDKAGASGYMDVAQKAANRAVSFGEHNRPLLPINLQAKASPIESFNVSDKGKGGGSSGGSDKSSSVDSNDE